MSKPLIVFDVDNVLANITHRLHLIECDDPDWNLFNSPKSIMADAPNRAFIYVYRQLWETSRIEIWTGRQHSTYLATRKWMERDVGKDYIPQIRMRKEGDRRSNAELKRSFIAEHGRPRLVFDGMPETIKMWEDRGIPLLYSV